MKLLFLLNRLVIGGQCSNVIPLAHALSSQQIQVHLLYGEKETGEVEPSWLLKKYPLPIIKKIDSFHRSINPFNDLHSFLSIYRYIKSYRPDVIHTHGAKCGLLGRLAAKLAGVPVIVHTFHGHLFHSYYNRFFSYCLVILERMLSRITHKIIATSQPQWQEFVEVYKIAPAGKVDIIQLGLEEDITGSDEANPVADCKKEFPAGCINIGIIARIVEVKNFDLFTRVVESVLQKSLSPIRFFVIGDGSLKMQTQEKLTVKKITWCNLPGFVKEAKVIFTSWIADITSTVNELDLVMLTSLNEGTGLSLAEAQAAGKPVVATNVGAIRDTMIDGETGFLVDHFNVEEFAAKLLLLINNASLRKAMGEKARIFARRKFSRQREVEQVKELYYHCLKEKNQG